MGTEHLEERAKKLFVDSYRDQERDIAEAANNWLKHGIYSYHRGVRDVLQELFPGISLE